MTRLRVARRAIAATLLVVAVAGLDAPTPGRPAPALHLVGVTSGSASGPDIAVNDRGDAIAAWYRTVDDLYRIEARFRPAGGSWGETKTLSAGSPTTNAPHVTIDPEGNAAVIWLRLVHNTQTNVDENRIQTARRAAGTPEATAWSAVKTLSPPGGMVSAADIVMDGHGNTTAAWSRYDGSFYRIELSRRPQGGTWSAPQTMSPAGEGADIPVLAADGAGDTMLVWQSQGTGWQIKSRRRPAGGTWQAVKPLSPAGENPDSPDLGMDDQGRVVVSWRGVVDSANVIRTRRRTSQGWGAIATVSPAGVQASEPGQLAVSPGGDAYIAWVGVDSGKNRAQVVRRPVGGTWSQPVKLSGAGLNATQARVGVNRHGDAVAIWAAFDGVSAWVDASSRPAGGAWGLATQISEPSRPSSSADVVIDNRARAHALLISLDVSIYRIQTTRRSAAGAWTTPTFLSPLP